MEAVIGSQYVNRGARTINGETYPNSISREVGGCSRDVTIEYNLSRQWTTFHAIIGLDDSSDTGAEVDFQFYVDGAQVSAGHTLGLAHHKDIEIPVNGALRLKLVTILVRGDMGLCSDAGEASWGDARLIGS